MRHFTVTPTNLTSRTNARRSSNHDMFRMVHKYPHECGGRRELIAIGNELISLAGSLRLKDQRKALIVVPIAQGELADESCDTMLADALSGAGFNTLLLNLLLPDEAEIDRRTARIRHHVYSLSDRLIAALKALRVSSFGRELDLGIFASGSSAAVGLCTAAAQPDLVRALVSRSGRPDLAEGALTRVATPTLLIVGEQDRLLKRLNEQAKAHMRSSCDLDIVAGASRLFDGPNKQMALADRVRDFFDRHLRRAR